MYNERAEFYLHAKSFYVSKKFMEMRDSCSEKIHEIILDSIIEYDREQFGKLMKMPAEMYPDCETLGRSIARFAVYWGSGKDKEFHEGIDELEDEIVICYLALKEEEL